MKFGKLFRATVDGRMPQWKAFVVQYKELKQAIKKLVAKQRTPDAASPDGLVASFTQLLDVEVSRVNNFYMDRIEEGVIILQLLRQESDGVVAAAASSSGLSLAAQRHACKQQLVTFHLNLLILQNYVALNFMAVSKILKKFDKQLQVALRAEYTAAIVDLPFYRCAALGQLVEDSEAQFHALEALSPPQIGEPNAAALNPAEEAVRGGKSTVPHGKARKVDVGDGSGAVSVACR